MTIDVAIVEDDVFTRERFQEAIESHRALSVAAAVGTVREAMDVLQMRTVDVLLLDLGLPDGTGHDVIHFVNRQGIKLDILVSTIFCDEENVVSAIAAGAVGYLLKDEPPDHVASALLHVVSGGAPISPKIARCILRRLREFPDRPLEEELSRSESDVLALVAKGLTNQEVAQMLGNSPHTVAKHVKNIYGKLQICSRAEAAREALRRGIL